MAYSRGFFFAFFIVVAISDKVTGSLLRNLKNNSNVDNSQDVAQHETTFSDQFQNHEGGVIDSPSGFLCLEVVELSASNSGEDEKRRFSCRYKEQGVIVGSKLGDIDGIFDDQFQHDSKLFLKGAMYEESTNTIQITPEVQFVWLTTISEEIQTKNELKKTSGTKTVLVFRIISNGQATTGSAEQLSNWVFGTSGDKGNLKSQYEACSFNELKFTPASGKNIVNGVVEAKISTKSSEYDAMSKAAVQYAQNTLGIPVYSFDHLMFALPRGATEGGRPISWPGNADYPGKNSWYADRDIIAVALQMHEVGHNLGLDHSGQGPSMYGDLTCTMGSSEPESDCNRCFNAAKMKQLGWYTNREKTIDPSSQTFSGKIIGVNDYGISTSQHTLVLEIMHSDEKENLYLTYNKAEGINKDTVIYRNQIVVVTQANVNPDLDKGRRSNLIEHIGPGSSATVPNFSGSRDLEISFERVGSDGDVNYAYVDVKLVSGAISREE